MEERLKTDYTIEIYCPYCYFKHEEERQFGNSGKIKCNCCKKEFQFETHLTTTYSTYKIVE